MMDYRYILSLHLPTLKVIRAANIIKGGQIMLTSGVLKGVCFCVLLVVLPPPPPPLLMEQLYVSYSSC